MHLHKGGYILELETKVHPNIRDHEEVMKMRVREVESDSERKHFWKASVDAYPPYEEYQSKTSRKIPVFIAEPY